MGQNRCRKLPFLRLPFYGFLLHLLPGRSGLWQLTLRRSAFFSFLSSHYILILSIAIFSFMYKEQGIKKASSPLKDEAVSPCYHLNSQTAHTACLKRYTLSRIPGYYNVYHLRCSLLNFYVIRCKAQGCIHVLLSMRLSSAGCFLYAFAENYLFPSLPSHEIKAIIGSYIIFVNGIFLRCNFHKVIL